MYLSPRRVLALAVISILFLLLSGCSGTGSSPVVPPERDESASGFGALSSLLTESKDFDDEYWQDTIEIDGLTWSADIMPDGDIHRALGKGIKLDGSIEEFIDSHPGIFQVSSDNLWLMSNEKHDGIRYVIYRQAYDGIPILDSRIDLRFGRGGSLVMVGADVFPEIYDVTDVPTSVISGGTASGIAVSYHEGEVTETELYIKPVDGRFIPVWRTFVGDWLLLISAIDGSLIDETELVWEYDFTGTVEGEVNDVNAFDPKFNAPLAHSRVQFQPGIDYNTYCDATGAYHYATDAHTEIATNARILGRWVNVNNYVGDDADITMTTYEGTPAEFLFDSSNAAPTEANVYYWTTLAHDYIKDIDPGYTADDFTLTANVNRAAWCNANASASAINFYLPASGCINLGEIADVIIHEYGHVTTNKHYNSTSIPPGDIHEGFSDYIANTITDQPLIGMSYKGDGTHMRNSDNELYWPDNNCGGEVHCLGEYLAGALWDLRDRLGREECDDLWWFSKYGKPTTFPDVATEICIADDDNDNLADGTPNYWDIRESFKVIHGIPVPDAPDLVDMTIDVIPDSLPIEINTATGGTFGYQIHVINNLPWGKTVEGWVAVKRPNGVWYGPMMPPSHYIAVPINLYIGPNGNFYYHLNQNIPGGLPAGLQFQYYVRLGDYIDLTNDTIYAEDMLTFAIVN
jgi:hypothetical protein